MPRIENSTEIDSGLVTTNYKLVVVITNYSQELEGRKGMGRDYRWVWGFFWE